ncbi:MAG: macrolide ABC transporter ATP-binding protein [Deltaproteobacteria bacterium]|nr:MAG: macrolide ABC transporter ATP-binding protein [Deltaproteobacteria bacterium]
MISLKDIHKSYTTGANQLHVLRGINLTIAKGEMVAVMGSSGSGKSTLLNIMGLLDSYDTGLYQFDGKALEDMNETRAARFRNQNIGFVFQSFHLIPFKTALENVALPLYYRNVDRKKRNQIALGFLDKFGIADWANHLPAELSGGQKQRTAIARAMIADPSILLADEPTGALDSSTSQDVMEVFKQVNAQGTTIVVITHEKDIASATDRIVNITDGVIK